MMRIDKKNNIYKMLFWCGLLLVLLCFILIRKYIEYLYIFLILLIVGIFLMIPDYYLYVIHKKDKLKGYKFSKFIGLVFILLIILIAFIILIIK